MSGPTPGPDPYRPEGGAPQGQPGWGAPQGQPGWGAPQEQPGWRGPEDQPGWGQPQHPAPGQSPAPSWSGQPAGYGSPSGQRPGQVKAAAIIGMVIGGFGTFFGVLGLLALGLVFEAGAVLGLLYLLSLATAVVLLVGGIQTMQGKSPRLLLLGSYASIGVQLLYTIFAMSLGEAWFSGLLGFALPILIVVLLRHQRSREYFAARGLSY